LERSVRVVWHPGIYCGLLSGDQLEIVLKYNGATYNGVPVFVGSYTEYNAILPVDYNGTLTVHLITGPNAGVRYFNEPIICWPIEREAGGNTFYPM